MTVSDEGAPADATDGDAALVRAVAGGDRLALGALYDRFAPQLLAVGQRILGDRRESEDLLHDVFLEAWQKAGGYDPERGSVRAWLILRMRSRCLDRRKAAGYARAVPLADEPTGEARPELGASPPPPTEDPLLGPDRTRVRRALAALPLEQRQVLELGYFEGLSSSEMAARLEAPIGTIKSRVAAALGKLRAALAGEPRA